MWRTRFEAKHLPGGALITSSRDAGPPTSGSYARGSGFIEASRGEYPTIGTTKRGDLAAFGKLDIATLGIQMPVVAKRSRKPRAR